MSFAKSAKATPASLCALAAALGGTVTSSEAEERAMQHGYDRQTYGFSRSDLESLGERAVRDKLNTGAYGHPGLKEFTYVSAWLADKEFVRHEMEGRERDQRERLTLRAVKIANFLAIIAILISIVSLFF